MELDRKTVAEIIAGRIAEERDRFQAEWGASTPVRHFVVDNLLPEEVAELLPQSFPRPETLMLRSSIRERKRVGVDLDRYAPLLGEVLHAFQQPATIDAVRDVTGSSDLVADPSFYASGISVMGRDDFLNPHIDNSHDGDIRLYRAFNLLYYVSPHWQRDNGGNLELWDSRVRIPQTVDSRFNRLVVMQTDPTSWHSVSRVLVDQPRYCISNYLFSTRPPIGRDYRHVTTFTGRPDEPLKRAVLKVVDTAVLNVLGRYLPALTKRTKHRIKA